MQCLITVDTRDDEQDENASPPTYSRSAQSIISWFDQTQAI
jgi:hypothetical protein